MNSIKQNPLETPHTHIILYDGICKLCNGMVRFIHKHHHKGKFTFIPLQSPQGLNLSTQYQWPQDNMDTIILIRDKQLHIKSTAVLLILKEMGGIWHILSFLKFLPLSWRDKTYDLIARHRYRLFGKEEGCPIS